MPTPDTSHEQLRELLQICEDYFRHAGPATHADLEAVLRRHHITGGPGWLIDMLGLTLHRLQHENATSTAGSGVETAPESLKSINSD